MHPGERIRLSSLPAAAGRTFRPGAVLAGPRRLGTIAALGVLLVVAVSAAALAHGGTQAAPPAASSGPAGDGALSGGGSALVFTHPLGSPSP